MANTIPPDTRASLQTGHIGDHNNIADMLTLVSAVNVKNTAYSGGAKGDGTTDDTTAIQAAINAVSAGGGVVWFPPGTYKVSSPLSLASPSVTLAGAGWAATVIQPSASFSGAQVIGITADGCGARDLTIAYASTSTGTNPAADGIRITGSRSGTLYNVYLNYINGWGAHSTGTAAVANYWWQFINVHTYQCSSGIRVAGNVTTGFNAAHTLTNCIADQCTGGDGFAFEDAHDVQCVNLEGSVTAGSGATCHIKGACAGVYVSNVDLGPAPGPSTGAAVLIETGTNGDPKQITFNAGILEGSSAGATITAGSQIRFVDLDIINNGTYGMNLSGTCDALIVEGCLFNLNGSAGTTGRYDFQSSTTGHVEVNDCYFLTSQGTSAQHTNNAVNVTAGTVTMQNDTFSGTGYTVANMFSGFPKVARNCPGYNPVGAVTVTVPASTVAAGSLASDATVYIKGGTVTVISVNGTVTGLTLASGGFVTVRVPAQGTITMTYSVAPTWQWISD